MKKDSLKMLPRFAIIILTLMLLTACQLLGTNLKGHISSQSTLTLWSFFPNKDIEVLIRNYEAVHPEVKIIHTGYSFSSLSSAFKERAKQGLGPDAVIVTERDLPALIEADLATNLDAYNFELDTENISESAMSPLKGLDGNLYGVPIAFQTMALCYNKTKVESPPKNFQDWLAQGKNGAGIALEAGFLKSMWGIGALGAPFSVSANKLGLKESSLVQWLTWLKEAKKIPNVYIDHRPEVLYNLFANGSIAYFPCWTFEFVPLKEELKSDLAVAPLPKAADGQPSPYLETDVVVINAYATKEKKQLAFNFAQFLTQPDQQLALISGKEHTIAPINTKTLVDERLLPIIHAFASNISTAVPFPISETYRLDRLRFYGDSLYRQVLQGDTVPTVGVKKFMKLIRNPPDDEEIVVSTSAASDEVQEVVLVDVKPDTNYLVNLFKTGIGLLLRRALLLQIITFGVVLSIAWMIAQFINKWLKKVTR